MLRNIVIVLALLAVALILPAAGEEFILGDGRVTAENGVITGFADSNGEISLAGLYADVGCDGAFVQNTVGYQRFWDMNTWDIAPIVPKVQAPYPPEEYAVSHQGDALALTHVMDGLRVTLTCTMLENALEIVADITSERSHVSEIQGVYFLLRGIAVPDDAAFRFPGNTPGGVFRLADMRPFAVRQTDYCNPVTMARAGNAGFNAIFLNAEEKWGTGVYRDREGGMNIGFLSMTEGLLAPGDTMRVGKLYLQTTGYDAYAPIQALYKELGFRPPDTGYLSGPVYSCHPAGTMDSGFRDVKTMRAYADSLPKLAAMGVESVWVLPIFEHTRRGVYEPADQRLIDKRYGTDADVRHYVDAAHALGIRVLFDYVPHGPFPDDPLAKDNPQWCSVARNGDKQIEWDCVSFDMASADYQAYTAGLIADHVARFGVDGGRIDCAMGGLSNWKPQAGNRASSSGLKGGQGIVAAIRQGFESAGVTPLLLPENFHPLPFYAAVTDIFYDMPLYRLMHEMRQRPVTEAEFAVALADWLDSEYRAGVPGQLRLRFLGNHDTVSWTWDTMRPTAVYGEGKAKALWTLFSFIDGVPFIYMGDEDSDLYHFRGGYDLTAFFTELFAARRAYLSDDMTTRYALREDAVVAFYRQNDSATRLILVNLCKDAAEYILPLGVVHQPLYGDGVMDGMTARLPGYGCLMLDVTPLRGGATP